MGLIYANLQVSNYGDKVLHERGAIPNDEVRSRELTFLVDTGAYLSVLPEKAVKELGLKIVGTEKARYADGRVEQVGITEAVELKFDNRTAVIQAMVTGDEPLLGATTMQLMDVVADPAAEALKVNPAHPDEPIFRV